MSCKVNFSHFQPTVPCDIETKSTPSFHCFVPALQTSSESKGCLEYTWEYIKNIAKAIYQGILRIFQALFCCSNVASRSSYSSTLESQPENVTLHGLTNMGNTCYGNSVLHILFASSITEERIAHIMSSEPLIKDFTINLLKSNPERTKAEKAIDLINQCTDPKLTPLRKIGLLTQVVASLIGLENEKTAICSPIIRRWQQQLFAHILAELKNTLASATIDRSYERKLQTKLWNIPGLTARIYRSGSQDDAHEYFNHISDLLQLDKKANFGVILQKNLIFCKKTDATFTPTEQSRRSDPLSTSLAIEARDNSKESAQTLLNRALDWEVLPRETKVNDRSLKQDEECRVQSSFALSDEEPPPEEFAVNFKIYEYTTAGKRKFNNRNIQGILEPIEVTFTKDTGKQKVKYSPVVISAHAWGSVDYGHYVAYRINRKTGMLETYNDSSASAQPLEEAKRDDKFGKTAYLVLYRISKESL